VIASARSSDGSFVAITRRVMLRMLAYLEEDKIYRAVQGLLLLKTGAAPDLYAGQPRQRDEIQAKEVELAAVMYPLEHRQIEERDPLEAHEDHWIDVGASATNDVAPPRQIARRRARGGDPRGGRIFSG
jgi:hypothetical protein